MRRVLPPTSGQLAAAGAAVARLVGRSPVVESPALLPGGRGLLKVETLNRAGSFKLRGAVAALSALPDGRPVVTCSGGNHGLAVAIAAGMLGREATIVVSVRADPSKIDRIRRTGCRLVLHGDTYDEAERHAVELAAALDAAFVSPYNDPVVIAGQATIGRELAEELGEDLTIVTPVGGGGLAAGVALAAGRATVVGAEAERSPAMSTALRAGEIMPIEPGPTLADPLTGNLEPGSVTFPLVRDHVAAVVTVSEEEIASAMRFLHTEHGLVAEGAGAVAVAAVRAGRVSVRTAACVAVVTGRNVDPRAYARVLSGESA